MTLQTPFKRPSNAARRPASPECERPSNALQTAMLRCTFTHTDSIANYRSVHAVAEGGFAVKGLGTIQTPFKRPSDGLHTHPPYPL